MTSGSTPAAGCHVSVLAITSGRASSGLRRSTRRASGSSYVVRGRRGAVPDKARHSCFARVASSMAWNGADEAERLDWSIKRIYSKWTAPFDTSGMRASGSATSGSTASISRMPRRFLKARFAGASPPRTDRHHQGAMYQLSEVE